MPLKWERGRNPYLDTCYARLQIGPNVVPNQIVAQAKTLKQKLNAGGKLEVGGQALDEHAIGEAQRNLLGDETRAHELLLVHSEPASEAKRIAATCESLRQAATPPDERAPLPLAEPAAIFWFTPAPGPEAALPPPWSAFAFIEPGAPEDLAGDIVFDR